MPIAAPFADRLRTGIARLAQLPRGGPDDEALNPLRRSLERTLVRANPGMSPAPAMFRFQMTGGKALLFLGGEALPLEPSALVRLLNTIGVDMQAGESVDVDGTLAAWLIRPEVTLTDTNLRQADGILKSMKGGRDRDHAAAQTAESAKIRLRGRLTQLVTALQAAQTDAGGKVIGPPIPLVSDLTPPPAPPPPKAAPPPPPPPVVVQAPPPPPKPVEPIKPGPVDALLAQALRKLLAAIEGSGFKAAAVGDIAHVAWGSRTPARRVELLVAFEGPQREMLLSAARGEGLRPAPSGEPMHMEYTDEKLGGTVPVELVQATSSYRKQVINRAQPGNALGCSVRLATCEDLILMRAASTEPGHQATVVELLRGTAGRLDGGYVKKEAEAANLMPALRVAWGLAKAQP